MAGQGKPLKTTSGIITDADQKEVMELCKWVREGIKNELKVSRRAENLLH